jgi:hypothetical protein
VIGSEWRAGTDTKAKARLKGDRYRVKGWTWEFFRFSLRVMPRAILLLGFRSPRCHRWRRSTDPNLCPGSPCGWLGLGVGRAALRRCVPLERNKLDAQPAADGAANHLQCADPFTAHPPAVDEIHSRANTIDLDYGGLYGNDLDD